jgi:hypothetical protein
LPLFVVIIPGKVWLGKVLGQNTVKNLLVFGFLFKQFMMGFFAQPVESKGDR